VPLVEVGVRHETRRPVCEASGREEDVRARCSQTIMPGYVYEVQLYVDPPVRREDAAKVFELVRTLERRMPKIGINYLSISDDGRVITFQVFDPEPAEHGVLGVPLVVAIIVVAALLTVVSVFTYLTVTRVVTLVEEYYPPEEARKTARYLVPLLAVSASVALAGVGVYLIATSIKR
jgi:hypothetical protein